MEKPPRGSWLAGQWLVAARGCHAALPFSALVVGVDVAGDRVDQHHPITLSPHHPLSMDCTFTASPCGCSRWRRRQRDRLQVVLDVRLHGFAARPAIG